MTGELILTKLVNAKAQAIADKNSELRKAYRAFRCSPDGKLVMEDLEKRFYNVDLSGVDSHKTAVLVGRHSVVLHISNMGAEVK